MDCHANILYNYQTKTPKYAAMAVYENFFRNTNSLGIRTTYYYTNETPVHSVFRDMIHKGRNNGCFIDNQQYSGLIKIRRDLFQTRERLNIFMVKFQVNLRKIAP